jgi:hypothetical protein
MKSYGFGDMNISLDLKERPRPNLLTMLVCYIDERATPNTITLACVIATDKKWLRFDEEWRRSLAKFRVPYLHMQKLVPRPKGVYAGWSYRDADTLIEELVCVFKRHVSGWCGTTISVKDFYANIPADDRRRARDPYSYAFHACISDVMVYCEAFKVSGKVSFMLDQGSVSQSHAAIYFEAFKTFKDASQVYQLGALLFDDKETAALQAADLLAFEINKHAHGYERKSFAQLCELPHDIIRWDSANLREIADKVQFIKPIFRV